MMNLGEMIDALRHLKPDAPVIGVEGLGSYRGFYDELAFGSGDGTYYTVAAMLAACEEAVGKKYCGYKGGEYQMTPYTPLWRSEYGRASGCGVFGLVVQDGGVSLWTKMEEWV